MNSEYLFKLLNMSIDELKEELEKFVFNEEDRENVKRGREIIDNFLELKNSSNERVGQYLALYTIYKSKEGK